MPINPNVGRDYNEFYRLTTPIPTPLPFGGFYRLACNAICQKCGRSFIQVLRVHKTHIPSFLSLDKEVLVKPNPSDEKIMTSLMIRACDNGIGCFKPCRPWKHVKVCQLPSKRLLLAHNPHLCKCPPSTDCTCEIGCGNKGIYPCQCGHAFGPHGKHNNGCPVGLYKRDSQFALEFMRSQLIKSHRA